ncbi:MAG: hypothetical protein HC811_03835 [Flammeovirgaceae bacterium]|nr:hypothetical protein [Flammeovirgaceae bacterium]
MKGKADVALTLLDQNNITSDDFNNKDRGTPIKFFREFSEGRHYDSSGSYMQAQLRVQRAGPAKRVEIMMRCWSWLKTNYGLYCWTW